MASRLRASDSEREEAAALLSQAAADGRIDVEELDARSETSIGPPSSKSTGLFDARTVSNVIINGFSFVDNDTWARPATAKR